jgi:hypothetical protein
MPSATIITPGHAASITRTTLGITGTRDAVAPGAVGGIMFVIPFCSASEDE